MTIGEAGGYPSEFSGQVNERVIVEGKAGAIRWVGKLPRGDGQTTWVGIEYDEPVEKLFFRFFATGGSKKSKKVAKNHKILNEIDMKTQNRALSKFQILTELYFVFSCQFR